MHIRTENLPMAGFLLSSGIERIEAFLYPFLSVYPVSYTHLEDPEAGIDLGAIAKGYIADQVKTYLKKQGIKHAIINLGGNVDVIGTKPDGSKYNIGIQKPFDESGEAITSVQLKDQTAVSYTHLDVYKRQRFHRKQTRGTMRNPPRTFTSPFRILLSKFGSIDKNSPING